MRLARTLCLSAILSASRRVRANGADGRAFGTAVARRWTLRERGQVMMVAALLLPLFLSFLGIAIDVGFVAARHRHMQNAADAAALAAAGVLLNGGSALDARAAAIDWSAKNGYSWSETTIHIPPTGGVHVGNSNYVEVIVDHSQSLLFMSALNIPSISETSRAVAGFTTQSRNYALVVLDPTKCSSYNQSSGNTLTIVGGGAMIDSNCHPAGALGGGSSLNADFISYYASGSWSLSNNATTSVPPRPYGVRIADPLSGLAPPAAGTTSVDSGGTAAAPKTALVNSNTPVTLHPGTYYGGLKITGSGAITFSPGTYIFAGGGFDYSASSTIMGTDVTLYNTLDPTHSSGQGACGAFAIQGSGSLNFAAPTTGTYANMLFWQDPACTNAMKYAGSSYTTTGVIYLPTGELQVSGGGALGAMQVIVDSFSFSGSTSVSINYGNYVPVQEPKVTLQE
jgi:putative Flp pilus-assembly TadE/G-like protein